MSTDVEIESVELNRVQPVTDSHHYILLGILLMCYFSRCDAATCTGALSLLFLKEQKKKENQDSDRQAHSGKQKFKLDPKLSDLYVQIFKAMNVFA